MEARGLELTLKHPWELHGGGEEQNVMFLVVRSQVISRRPEMNNLFHNVNCCVM